MDFKGFYDALLFDVDQPILKSYTGKQGDTKSRGLYVTVTQKNAVIDDLTGLSMRFFYEKPDKTRGFIDGVVDGNKFRIDYTNQMYAVPGVVKAELRLMGADGEIITAKTFKILVDSSIADGSIVSENERGILDRAFELAEDIIPRLELLDVELLENVQGEIEDARHDSVDDVTYDSLADRLNQDKLDYVEHRSQDQLKVAKVEKELNDYKATMQQVNINQEPKQKATGYGVISLPPNAAEGQVSGVVRGETLTSYVDKEKLPQGDIILHKTNQRTLNIADPFTIVPNEVYTIFVNVKNMSSDGIFSVNYRAYDSDTGWQLDRGINRRVFTAGSDTTLNRLYFYIRTTADDNDTVTLDSTILVLRGDWSNKHTPPFFRGTKSTVGAMRIKSVSEDESEVSTAYVVAKDKDGKIAELRSLPNGTKDEINVTDRKLIKRIGEKSNIANGVVIDFADMAEGGTYYAWNEDGETETGIKGDTLGIDAATLIYQLAEPIEIPVQVSGSIVSYPNGTIYIERILPDAGVYTDKITILHQDAPIKRLDKLSKVDFMTGIETELDINQAEISEDKLSFTHPELQDGDIVFFEYEYDIESTEGETEVEFYDSRYVVKDTETGKFYKWNIVVANGQPSIELVEV